MYCICCKKDKVKPDKTHLKEISEEKLLWEKEEKKMSDGSKIFQNINNQMVNGGIIHIIEAGYGSTHDGDMLIMAICDDCINENMEDATLLYYNNYMFNGASWVSDKVEKSKKKYRRRKNLDNLT